MKRTVTVRRETVVAMDTSNESKLSRSQSLKDNLQCIAATNMASFKSRPSKLMSAKSSDKISANTSGVSSGSPNSSGNRSSSGSNTCHGSGANGVVADSGPVTGNSCSMPLFNHIAVVTLRMQEAVSHCLRVMPVGQYQVFHDNYHHYLVLLLS